MNTTHRGGGGLGLPGWDRLRHGGLLLDATRLATFSQSVPGPLAGHIEPQLRQRAGAIPDGGGDGDGGSTSSFVAFVLMESWSQYLAA